MPGTEPRKDVRGEIAGSSDGRATVTTYACVRIGASRSQKRWAGSHWASCRTWITCCPRSSRAVEAGELRREQRRTCLAELLRGPIARRDVVLVDVARQNPFVVRLLQINARGDHQWGRVGCILGGGPEGREARARHACPEGGPYSGKRGGIERQADLPKQPTIPMNFSRSRGRCRGVREVLEAAPRRTPVSSLRA